MKYEAMVKSLLDQGVPIEKAQVIARRETAPVDRFNNVPNFVTAPYFVTAPSKKSEGQKGRHLKSPTEHQEQRALFLWIDGVKGQPETGYAHKHLEFARIFAIPNGGYRSIATAAMMKAEGVRRGYFDIGWDLPRGRHTGFRGELKRIGDGSLSPGQMEWENWYERCGLYTCAVEGWEAMRDELLRYFGRNV